MGSRTRKAINRPDIHTDYGWVHVGNQFRPFKIYREIRRGRNKGSFEVTLPDQQKRVVLPSKIRRFPEELQTVQDCHQKNESESLVTRATTAGQNRRR